MPFSEIKILIAEDDLALANLWERICTEIGFQVTKAITVREALEHVGTAHILLADLMLADGRADLLISNWVEHNGGPLVCVSGVLSESEIWDFILQGAYNAFAKTDFTNEMVRTLVVRYAKWVMLKVRLDALENQIKLQRYAIGGLTALVLGKELWSFIAPLFFP